MRHGLFTKEQLAKPHGLSSATIDLYVAYDLLYPINLSDGVYFTSSDMLRLEIILKGKSLGYSLPELKVLMENAKRENDRKKQN